MAEIAYLLDGRRWWRRFKALLPAGHAVTDASWRGRHRAITALLWGHVVAVPVFGVITGNGFEHSVFEGTILAVFALGASHASVNRNARSVMATLGLVSASGILTHMSGGLIEMHFHFFVVVAVVALYQSWVPFLLALAFVVLHHGIAGQLAPESVYNHPAALANAWKWALVHGVFILAESAACLVAWRMSEDALNGERAARSEMQKANRDLAAAQALSNLGSWDWDIHENVVWWSEELYQIFGRERGRFVPSLAGFFDQIAPDDRLRVAELVETVTRDRVDLDFECRIVRPDGTVRTVHALGTGMWDDDGKPLSVRGTCQDITERKALEAEIEHRAFHDALTGLANRALFTDRLEHALAVGGRADTPLALLYLDLDDFKTVNDNLGHGVGDELLAHVAGLLRGAVRGSDTVARLGGDEFAVLLENTTADEAGLVADQVLGALQAPIALADATVLVRASVGIAAAESAGAAGDLLRQADIAMYAAKRSGKHAYRVFHDGMHSSLVARMKLEAELAEAIESEQLVVHYQPVIDMTDGGLEGIEALVRWEHPQRGLLPPSEFIPLAEELGLIGALGNWVLTRATMEARRLHDELGRPVYVSVNVAAPQLHSDIVGTVGSALQAAGLAPHLLVLEITETCLMSQEAVVVQ